jgi:hypothetical protein
MDLEQYEGHIIKIRCRRKPDNWTLDYYHSSSYVHDLVEKMPRAISKEKRKDFL